MFSDSFNDDFWAANNEVIRQNTAGNRSSKSQSGGLNEQGEHIFNKTAQSAYHSEPQGATRNLPELLIVAGIFLCRLALWYFLRLAQNHGIDPWDL